MRGKRMYRLSVTLSDANSVITTTGTRSSSSSSNSTPFTPPPQHRMTLDPSLAAKFPILARQGGVEGMEWAREGRWEGDFCFVQAADTQFGMIDHFINGNKDAPSWTEEIGLTRKAIHAVNGLKPKPKFFVVCGDLVDAMPGVSYRPDQVRDYKGSFLDPEIVPICVCGNHDIGDSPTKASIAQYQADFGDDYFSFWCGGVKFLVMNSQFYHDDSSVKDLRLAHDQWMDSQLSPNKDQPWKHLVGFQHIPPFVVNPEEDPVDVPGNVNLNFNYRDKDERRRYLHKLKSAGMNKLFCGHYHRNAGGWDGELEVIVTSAVGCQLGKDTHGIRLVKVSEEKIEHEYYGLDHIPSSITFQ